MKNIFLSISCFLLLLTTAFTKSYHPSIACQISTAAKCISKSKDPATEKKNQRHPVWTIRSSSTEECGEDSFLFLRHAISTTVQPRNEHKLANSNYALQKEEESKRGIDSSSESAPSFYMAVADGVGGWANRGVDPKDFSQALIDMMKKSLIHSTSSQQSPDIPSDSNGWSLKSIVKDAFGKIPQEKPTVTDGSSTLAFIRLRPNTLDPQNPSAQRIPDHSDSQPLDTAKPQSQWSFAETSIIRLPGSNKAKESPNGQISEEEANSAEEQVNQRSPSKLDNDSPFLLDTLNLGDSGWMLLRRQVLSHETFSKADSTQQSKQKASPDTAIQRGKYFVEKKSREQQSSFNAPLQIGLYLAVHQLSCFDVPQH